MKMTDSEALESANRRNEEVETVRDTLMQSLRSYESVIHYFQLLLVWEKPVHSAILVVILHLIFWYLKVCSSHAIGLLSSIFLILLWLDMWKHKIWPEIRARAPDPEADEWGELHPRVLSFPDVCAAAANAYVNIIWYWRIARDCRQDNPRKFVISTTVACLLTALVGRSIPGPLLAYVGMLCVITWPAIWYHRFLERAYFYVEPFLMQLQYSLKPRMKRTGKKTPHAPHQIDDTGIEVMTDSSSEEDGEILDFAEPLDAVTAEVLARALTDDEELSESEESYLASELPSLHLREREHRPVTEPIDEFHDS